jgi:hypothetical protein
VRDRESEVGEKERKIEGGRERGGEGGGGERERGNLFVLTGMHTFLLLINTHTLGNAHFRNVCFRNAHTLCS